MAEKMSEVVVPSTPPPQSLESSNSADMTPPPSTQPLKTNFNTARPKSAQRNLFAQSPPLTIKASTEPAIPTHDDIAKAEPDELRSIAQELTQWLAESRTSAAHFQLQHSLLAVECEESAQRAEIENYMTRREVEVLQSPEHHRGALSAKPQIIQQPPQTDISVLERDCEKLKQEKATLSKTCEELEEVKGELELHLLRAKNAIEKMIDKNELLSQENKMLKERIRQNRQHFNLMRQSPAFPSLALPPSNNNLDFATPQRIIAPQSAGSAPPRANSRNADPFAALLAADQMLSREPASLPTTPTKPASSGFQQGHTRGAYSLSSLQTTPLQPRPAMARERDHENRNGPARPVTYSAPNTQLVGLPEDKERRDRDSTISVSEEEVLTDDELPPSQASSLATSMLRQNAGSQESTRLPDKAEISSKALQTKLFGHVKKAKLDRKRHASFATNESPKKNKLTEGVGLGIGNWGT
jgi:regulator of replication initiation timing